MQVCGRPPRIEESGDVPHLEEDQGFWNEICSQLVQDKKKNPRRLFHSLVREGHHLDWPPELAVVVTQSPREEIWLLPDEGVWSLNSQLQPLFLLLGLPRNLSCSSPWGRGLQELPSGCLDGVPRGHGDQLKDSSGWGCRESSPSLPTMGEGRQAPWLF